MQISEFQFHKGTIKTFSGFKVKRNIVKFQFHKGTIKTPSLLDIVQRRIGISIP